MPAWSEADQTLAKEFGKLLRALRAAHPELFAGERSA